MVPYLSIKNSAEMTKGARKEGSLTVNTSKSMQVSIKDGDEEPSAKNVETEQMNTPGSSGEHTVTPARSTLQSKGSE